MAYGSMDITPFTREKHKHYFWGDTNHTTTRQLKEEERTPNRMFVCVCVCVCDGRFGRFGLTPLVVSVLFCFFGMRI